ncbi:MAG: CHAT domain-containing protein [Armatimonadota bacterium]
MGGIPYLDLDLLIQRVEGGFRAQVNSPAGQAAVTFTLPFSDLELEVFLLKVGRTRRATRRIDSPEVKAAKAFGESLFSAVFAGEARGVLRSSIEEARRQGHGLRIRLRLNDVPELAEIPWEYLYNPTLNRFLGLSKDTPIVRFLDLPERIQPLLVTPPLRVLVMISSPLDYPELDVEGEWAKLRQSLSSLEQRGLVFVERLPEPRLSALQKQLRLADYHVFHFIGHGGFDQNAQDGVLVLEDAGKRGRPVSGQDLGLLLHDHWSIRMAVLNACEGARTSRTDPFAGTAQSLVQQGLAAVIAMQFEITDEAAIAFAHEFYGAVADGYPVDAAVAEARKAIFAQDNGLEWGTPVLYLRAPDGRIFDVEHLRDQRPSRVERPEEPIAASPVAPSLERPGDTISANISGSVSGQVAVGKDITQTHVVTGAGVTEADLATLRGLIAALTTEVEAEAPTGQRAAALDRVKELEQAVTAKEPDLTTMERVKQWFITNLPALAGSVTSVVVHPIIGKLAAAAGDALAGEFRRRFGEK